MCSGILSRMQSCPKQPETPGSDEAEAIEESAPDDDAQPTEFGGRDGPDPVRYGDWEKNGRCIDF